MLFKSKKMILFFFLAVFASFAFQNCSRYLFQSQQQLQAPSSSSSSSGNAVMASLHQERNYSDEVFVGYQGWFATPDDDYSKSWFHWEERNGISHVDLLPDVSIYPDNV